jgi:hypothetical protein
MQFTAITATMNRKIGRMAAMAEPLSLQAV